jgi:GT2 family glycosyltransferase
MDVTVAILCWNGRKLLEKNLPSVIKASENKKNNIIEIIVVDDFSTDNSIEFIEKNYPKIRIIKHNKNFGYARACNTAMREAKSPLVTLLNLDVVPQADFLASSLNHFQDNKVFSVSFNEGKFGPGKLCVKNGFIEIEPSKVSKNFVETDWPSGGSAVFNKKIWELLGGMNEVFLPFYFEDVDLGVRAKKLGYISYWEPKCRVAHEHEGSINSNSFKSSYIDLIKKRNYIIFNWRNIGKNNLINNLKFLLLRSIKSPKFAIASIMAIFRILQNKLTIK